MNEPYPNGSKVRVVSAVLGEFDDVIKGHFIKDAYSIGNLCYELEHHSWIYHGEVKKVYT